MTVYVSTACLEERVPMQTRIRQYLDADLQNIELGANVVVSSPRKIVQFHAPGATFLIHNYFPPPPEPFVLNLASPDPDIRERSIQFVSDALRISAKLKSPFYSVHAGFISDPIAFGTNSYVFPETASEHAQHTAFERFCSALEIILTEARKLDLRILVENNVCTEELKGKLLLQTAEEFEELFACVPDSNLGILLDFGHLNVTARTFEFNHLSFISKLAARIGAFHVHDNNGLSDEHKPITADSWELEVLQQANFSSTPLIVEAKFDSVEELSRHVAWLQRTRGLYNTFQS